MKLRPYRTSDIDHISRRSSEDYGDEAFEGTKKMCEENVTYTYEHEGIPLAIIGIQMVWNKVGHI